MLNATGSRAMPRTNTTTAVTRWQLRCATASQGDTMEKIFNDKPLKLFMSYIAGHKKLFVLDMSCALLVSLIDLVFPYVSRVSMNKLLPEKLFSLFFTVRALMVLVYLIKAGLFYVITVLGHRMGVLIEADMRRDVFTHMQDLSCSFYDKNRTGVLMSRITSDLFEITELCHHGPENLLICSLTIVGALAVMFTIEWRLALTLSVAASSGKASSYHHPNRS